MPLMCKPNSEGVYLLVYEEILLSSERDGKFLLLPVSLSSVNCRIVCKPFSKVSEDLCLGQRVWLVARERLGRLCVVWEMGKFWDSSSPNRWWIKEEKRKISL